MSMSDVAPALIGIGGVAVGGSIQWMAATKAQRTQYLVAFAQKREAYYARLLLSVDRLALAHGKDADQCKAGFLAQLHGKAAGEDAAITYTRSQATMDSIKAATDEWRDVLGDRYLNAGDPVADTMSRLDRARESLVQLCNQGRLLDALAYHDGEFGRSIRRVKLAVGFAGAQGAAMVLRETSHWWNRKLRSASNKAVSDALKRLQEFESQTVEEA